jgi:hypothetical protein
MRNVYFTVTLVLLTLGYAGADVMVYGQGDDVTISRPYCST